MECSRSAQRELYRNEYLRKLKSQSRKSKSISQSNRTSTSSKQISQNKGHNKYWHRNNKNRQKETIGLKEQSKLDKINFNSKQNNFSSVMILKSFKHFSCLIGN